MNSKRELVYRFYEEVLNQGHHELLGDLVTEDLANHGQPGDEPGPAAILAVDKFLRGGFPDVRFQVEEVIVEGDRAAIRWTMTGTHQGEFAGVPASGKSIDVKANVIFGFRGDKVSDIWPVIDLRGLFQQIAA